MFPHQVTFCFCRRFHIEFLKIPSSAEHHFNIARKKTSIVPGTQRVLRNRAFSGIWPCSILLSGRFLGIARAFRLLPDRPVLRASNCRVLAVLPNSTVHPRWFLYSLGIIMLPWQSCSPKIAGDCKILPDSNCSLS